MPGRAGASGMRERDLDRLTVAQFERVEFRWPSLTNEETLKGRRWRVSHPETLVQRTRARETKRRRQLRELTGS